MYSGGDYRVYMLGNPVSVLQVAVFAFHNALVCYSTDCNDLRF